MTESYDNACLPAAAPSPRIHCGVLKWYEGDTFTLQVDFDLHDQDGTPVTIQPADEITVVFFNKRRDTVKRFCFTGVSGNCVLLTFDGETTALFSAGKYTYDIYYNGFERKTLSRDSIAIVE